MKLLATILTCGILGGLIGGLAGIAIEKFFPKKDIQSEIDELRHQYNL